MRTGGGTDPRAGKSRKKTSAKGPMPKPARRPHTASEQFVGQAEEGQNSDVLGPTSSDTNLNQSSDTVPHPTEAGKSPSDSVTLQRDGGGQFQAVMIRT